MPFESDKVMFEIYKERTYSGRYRVVFYTELDDHNKDWEINRAMAGESFYDGFVKNYRKEEAKQIIEKFVERLNGGEQIDPKELTSALAGFAAT